MISQTDRATTSASVIDLDDD
ncbi:hypothetical protein A2U01_0050762 [Trifolium medium]|uniref:Uncharacterized protein n=1 Tax=Trifolium medium TaxID=97028 RepID=A0A392QYW6_9FABA|nr:hypothetical protein [Trifolium medium]